MVSLVLLHPGHWFTPVMWWCMWATGSHPCIILQVCMRFVCESCRRTVLTDGQCISLSVLSVQEYFVLRYSSIGLVRLVLYKASL